jgi:Rrf2 family nitric oxide-sensitive transcriptional repressor
LPAAQPATTEIDLRLSLFTDFSLRLLMYLAVAEKETWVKTPDVARAFGISLFHLQKAVQQLVRAGHVVALQGRSGGLQLARDPQLMKLGEIVAELEGSGCLVDCARGPCPLAGNCLLKGALDDAELGFIRALDRYTLADVAAGRTRKRLEQLVTLHSHRMT